MGQMLKRDDNWFWRGSFFIIEMQFYAKVAPGGFKNYYFADPNETQRFYKYKSLH